ncbi:hypothetical protein Hanom_Chr02g00131381 [Helianthus anomalus]
MCIRSMEIFILLKVTKPSFFDSVVFDVLKYSVHFFKRSTQFVIFVAKQSRTKGSHGSGSIRDIKKLHFTKHIPTTITALHLLNMLGLCSNHYFKKDIF